MLFSRTLILFCSLYTFPTGIIAMQLSETTLELTQKATPDKTTTDFSTKPIFYNMSRKHLPKQNAVRLEETIEQTQDQSNVKSVVTGDELLLSCATSDQDCFSSMHKKLSTILCALQEDQKSTLEEKYESFKMFKHEAQEWVRKCIQEKRSDRIIPFTELVTRAFRLQEETDALCFAHVKALQKQCIAEYAKKERDYTNFEEVD